MGVGKKGVLILALFLLCVQGVAAKISVEQIPTSVYNIGDRVVVGGSVAAATNLRGYLGIGFVCNAKKVQTTAFFVDLKANEPQSYAQLVTIPQGVEGNCVLQITLSDVAGNIVETQNAGTFVMTSVLNGNFQEVPKTFQLGDKLVVKGMVTKQDKTGVQGIATIYFKQLGEPVFIETTQITNGEVNYVKDLSLVPAGSYTLEVNVADTFGNKNVFVDISRFSINNNIDFDMTVDKKQYGPGESVMLSGLVKSTTNSKLVNVEVELLVDGKVQRLKLEENTKPFVFKYGVGRDAKAGDHVVRVSAKDAMGNFGEKEVVVNVQAQPTTLNLKLLEESAIPEKNIVFEVTLADQAGDPMQETVVAKLLNQKNEFEKSKLVQAQGQNFFIVPAGALPGLWRVEVEGLGLSAKKTFVVKEHKALNAQLEGETLTVTNVGNTRFDEYLAVKANDQESGKKLRLGPQDEAKVVLNQLFEPGTYTVYVPLTGQKFDNVVVAEEPSVLSNLASSIGDVTGNVVANANLPERKTTLVLLFVIILVSLAVVLKPRGESGKQRIEVRQERHGLRDYFLAKRRMQALKKERGSEGRAYRPEFGRADAQDVADFKERMQKAWDEHQKQEQREQAERSPYGKQVYSNKPKAEEQKQDPSRAEGNIFDIFK